MSDHHIKIVFPENGNGYAHIIYKDLRIGDIYLTTNDVAMAWGEIVHNQGNPNPPALIAQYLQRLSDLRRCAELVRCHTDNPFETRENGTDTNPSDAKSSCSEQ